MTFAQLPVLLTLSIVPLIVRFTLFTYPFLYPEIFNYWKSQAVIYLGFAAWVLVGNYFHKKWYVFVTFSFCILLILSTIFNEMRSITIFGYPTESEGLFTWLAYMGLFLSGAYFFKSEKDLKLALNAVTISICVIFIVCIFQYFKLSTFEPFTSLIFSNKSTANKFTITAGRAYGTFHNSNHLGTYTALLLPIFYKMRRPKTLVVLSIICILSGSKGALLGIFFGIGSLWLLPGLLSVAYYFGLGSLIIRLKIWYAVLPFILHNLWFGSGMGTLAFRYPKWDSYVIDRPHNIWIQMADSGGIPALVLLIFLFAFCKSKLIRVGIISFCVASCFDDPGVSVNPVAFCLLGIGYGIGEKNAIY